MCGIVGFFSSDITYDNRGVLTNMLESINHRGPDADGYYTNENIFFGHKRLIVIDPQGGTQPMIYQTQDDNKIVLVYNGELYNYLTLRDELIELGHEFKTQSDTEVLLMSYLEWGRECVMHMNGIFSFSIYDSRNKKIFAARDRFGVKPFFYHHSENVFVFASEIKALLKHPRITSRINEEGLCELMALSPSRTPGFAIFKDIDELEPGHWLEYDGSLKKHCYFKLEYRHHDEDLHDTAEHVHELLTNAIKKQLMSDVSIGTFLSGGLDSSLITAIASKHVPSLKTFSLSFRDNAKYFTKTIFQPDSDDEWVEVIRQSISTDHKQIILDDENVARELINCMRLRDFPGMADVDASLYLFCKEIKQNVTVALSGECADEIFGGYPWFYRQIDESQNEMFPWLRNLSQRQALLKLKLDLKSHTHARYFEMKNKIPQLPSDLNMQDKFSREMFIFNVYYFMSNLLERKDRMSMGNGLEVRVPFCDHELVSYAFNIPWHMKFYNGREKGILRLAMENTLPQNVLWRKKSPYPKTHNPLYKSIVVDMLKRELKNNPLSEILHINKIFEYADEKTPWYGQLMSGAQIIAYFFQLAHWFKEYDVQLDF